MELYIHIPFCVRKCNYCDFLSFPGDTELRARYVEALCAEIKESESLGKGEEVTSIFIGGGTPSLLSGEQMGKILNSIKKHFTLAKNVEISMESNPGTLTGENLRGYRAAGVNRLSIGLQSTEDRLLKRLGRIHTYEQFLKNYELARHIGFDNINIDLMSALPGQTLRDYEKTLKKVLALEPEHISAYSLILEEGTPFYRDDSILDSIPGEDEDREMYALTKRMLKEKGYLRYEISNYAKKGRECRHNIGYWDDMPYLGLGLGASSYIKGARFSNTESLIDYLRTPYQVIEKRKDYYILEEKDHLEEFMFMGLRKTRGVSFEKFRKTFGKEMIEIYGTTIDTFIKQGMLQSDGEFLFFTDRGLNVSNQILCEFLL